MGLLIGASVLSLLEFFDLLIYNCALKCREIRQKKKLRFVEPAPEKCRIPYTGDIEKDGMPYSDKAEKT